MDPLTIISLITTLAETLSAKEGAAPATAIVNVLKKLVDNNILKLPKNFPDLDTLNKAAGDAMDQLTAWLPFLRSKAGLPPIGGFDTVFTDAVKRLCFGSPDGTTIGGQPTRAKFDPAKYAEVNLSDEMRAEIGDPGKWLRVYCDPASVVPTDILQRAFVAWQDVIGCRVRFVHDQNAANVIVTVAAIDGQGGKLAEATVGDGPGSPLVATLTIDPTEEWTESKYLYALIHEIGHLLGLEHINDPGAIMQPVLQLGDDGNPKFTTPQEPDIVVAKQLWGEPVA